MSVMGHNKRHGKGESGMSCEGGRIWGDKDSISSLWSIIYSRITPLMILWTFLALLILIWHMTHTFLRQFLTPHQVLSLIKPSFHLYPIFPMMSHCVFALLLIFF